MEFAYISNVIIIILPFSLLGVWSLVAPYEKLVLKAASWLYQADHMYMYEK